MGEGYQKYVDLALVLAALALSSVLFKGLDAVWGMAGWPTYEGRLPLALPFLLSLALSLMTLVLVRRNERANTFFLEAAGELKKVTWPPRKTTVYSTGIVVVAIIFAAVVLYAFDVFWSWLILKVTLGGA